MYGHLWNKVSNQLPESVTGSINNMRERQTDRQKQREQGGWGREETGGRRREREGEADRKEKKLMRVLFDAWCVCVCVCVLSLIHI